MPRRSTWSVQDAKNSFSAVVDAASRGKPQFVTKHGKPAVVVVAASEYARLQHLEHLKAPTFVEHLLAMPTDGGDFDRLEDGRLEGGLRETDP
jgi:antitoxin Phd